MSKAIDWEKIIIREINALWAKSDKFLPCHGPSHHIRVWKTAKPFGINKKADMAILAAACLLHDVVAFNRSRIKNHDIESAKIARKILLKIGFPAGKIKKVYTIIGRHRSSKKAVGCLEEKIMRSFDKVDALGPLGIYRMIAPMAVRGYDLKTIISWFCQKKKIQAKWQSIEFPEIKKRYRPDYQYTLDFFKKLSAIKDP